MRTAIVGKWAGRLTALLLLIFWGAFFVEHLLEWFSHPSGPFPPAWVWVLQFLHLLMLVGFGVSLRWERVGAVLIGIGSLAFFGGIMLQDGHFERSLMLFALVNLIPVGCFACYWLMRREQTA